MKLLAINDTFPFKRLKIDFGDYKKIIYQTKHSITDFIHKRLRIHKNKKVQKPINFHTLFSLLKIQENDVLFRLQSEKRLLFAEFENRHQPTYSFQESEILGGSTGQYFRDKEIPKNDKISEIHVCYGFTVESIQCVFSSGKLRYTGSLHGNNASGKCGIYSLYNDEYLISIDICVTDVIGSIRFITSRGRISNWYGRGILPQYIKLGDHSSGQDIRTTGEIRIDGFCGYCSDKDLNGIGVIIRKNVTNRLFINFTDESITYFGRQNQEDIELDIFSSVLRLRSCDIRSNLNRSQNFAKRLRLQPIKALKPIHIAFKLSVWLFESISKCFNKKTRTDDEIYGRELFYKAKLMEFESNELKDKSLSLYNEIKQYYYNGQYIFNQYALGTNVYNQLLDKLNNAKGYSQQSNEYLEESKRLYVQSESILPSLQVNQTSRKYYDRLIKLGIILWELKISGIDLSKTLSFEKKPVPEFNLKEYEDEIKTLKIMHKIKTKH